MVACPSCRCARILIHVDAGPRARCLDCGATWLQDGAWQHSVTAAGNGSAARAVAKISVPNGVSSMDLALAVVGELQRAARAEVVGHDVAGGVPEITLRLPVPLTRRLELQYMQIGSTIERAKELYRSVMENREALLTSLALAQEVRSHNRAALEQLVATRESARQLLSAAS